MALSLGRLQLQSRGKKPGRCRPCQKEIEPYTVYALLRQYKRGGPGSGFFFVTLHPGCVSDYIHKSWDRHLEKDTHESGRREGSRGKAIAHLDEIELAIRAAKLQTRRRLAYQIRAETRPHKLYEMFQKIVEINNWLTEIGDTTWEGKSHFNSKYRSVFLTKFAEANQWASRTGQEKI